MTNAQRAAGVKADPNLHFTGANVTVGGGVLTAGVSNGHVRLHGPAVLAPGSTMSHWSTALTPNELMEPNYTGVNHNRGLALALFQDIGWTVQCPVAVAISSFGARSVDRGVELSARFQSSFGSVLVKVYRGEGAEGGLNNLASIPQGNKTSFTYVDETAVPGRSYRYMIGVVDQDGEFVSPIQTITLPKLVAELGQNVPNPFNPTTSIRFTLTSSEHVTINVFDVSGHLVRTLVDGVRAAGAQDVKWDGTNSAGNPVSSGIYYYRLQADKFSQSRKMVLLK